MSSSSQQQRPQAKFASRPPQSATGPLATPSTIDNQFRFSQWIKGEAIYTDKQRDAFRNEINKRARI